MTRPERQPELPETGVAPPPKVRPFPREVAPASAPTLGRGRKIVLASLVSLTVLVLAAAGVSAASSPAHGGGELEDCATQCPM